MLLTTSTDSVQAEVSNYKMRIHKNLLRNVIDKNFPIILDHIQGKNE